MPTPPLPLTELPAAFRQRGEFMERFAPGVAEAFRCCAELLEVSLAAHLEKPLSLEEASAEFGWSYEGLRRRLDEVPSLNAGRRGAPLIRRCDVAALGAPRGKRGKYRPRASMNQASPNALEQAEADAAEDPIKECYVPPPDRRPSSVGDDVAPGNASPNAFHDQASGEHQDEGEAGPASDLPAPQTKRSALSPRRGSRATAPHTRTRSRRERFDELLTLAARS